MRKVILSIFQMFSQSVALIIKLVVTDILLIMIPYMRLEMVLTLIIPASASALLMSLNLQNL